MVRDGDYVLELASTVNLMFSKGINDPQASEIAHEHFGDRTLGGEIIEGVRKRLPRIRRVLEEDYSYQICPLSRTYYTRFRRRPPLTEAEARRCLPIGHAVRQEGLYRLSGANDLIWNAWQRLHLNQGASKVKRRANAVLHAVAAGHLTDALAAEVLTDAAQHAVPDDRELAARVMQALPSPEELVG
jgi:hypothetical protein